MTRLLIDDVFGQVEHILGDFDILDIFEILLRIADLIPNCTSFFVTGSCSAIMSAQPEDFRRGT